MANFHNALVSDVSPTKMNTVLNGTNGKGKKLMKVCACGMFAERVRGNKTNNKKGGLGLGFMVTGRNRNWGEYVPLLLVPPQRLRAQNARYP